VATAAMRACDHIVSAVATRTASLHSYEQRHTHTGTHTSTASCDTRVTPCTLCRSSRMRTGVAYGGTLVLGLTAPRGGSCPSPVARTSVRLRLMVAPSARSLRLCYCSKGTRETAAGRRRATASTAIDQ
jgi:hypothetical protein